MMINPIIGETTERIPPPAYDAVISSKHEHNNNEIPKHLETVSCSTNLDLTHVSNFTVKHYFKTTDGEPQSNHLNQPKMIMFDVLVDKSQLNCFDQEASSEQAGFIIVAFFFERAKGIRY